MKKLATKFSKEKIKKYLKILVFLLIVAGISVGLYFLLRHLCNDRDFNGIPDDIEKSIELEMEKE